MSTLHMGDARVSQPTQMQRRAADARARLEAEGVNLAEWSRERGFNYSTVKQVILGNRPCKRGQSHKIAVALGIKDPPPSQVRIPAPTPGDRLEGART